MQELALPKEKVFIVGSELLVGPVGTRSGFVRSPAVVSSRLPSCKGKPSKAADDGDIESKIIEPASINHFINTNRGIKNAYDEGYGGYPTMPDSQEESSRSVL